MLVRNRNACNTILNPLREARVVKDVLLRQLSLILSLKFIIQKGNTLRFIVDLRKVNTKLFVNAYLILR